MNLHTRKTQGIIQAKMEAKRRELELKACARSLLQAALVSANERYIGMFLYDNIAMTNEQAAYRWICEYIGPADAPCRSRVLSECLNAFTMDLRRGIPARYWGEE